MADIIVNTPLIGGGSFNLNYNLGQSAGDIATGAYSFLSQQTALDNSLLSSTITGAQNFVNAQTAPLVSAAAYQTNQYTSMLPSLFTQLFHMGNSALQQQERLFGNTIRIQDKLATQSIGVSRKAAGSGGLCFITTAVCEYQKKPDDCLELFTLRHFRDTYMRADPKRSAKIEWYYRQAPIIVEKIKSRKDCGEVFALMYRHFILPAVKCVIRGENEAAEIIYSCLVYYALECANGH